MCSKAQRSFCDPNVSILGSLSILLNWSDGVFNFGNWVIALVSFSFFSNITVKQCFNQQNAAGNGGQALR